MFNFLGHITAAGVDIFGKIITFFQQISQILPIEYLLYGAVALLFFIVLVCLVISNKTYEVKALKFVKTNNAYFKRNPHITEENLMFVNNRFKNAPKNIRYAWQQYMLNRDKLPSEYINTRTCLDQPLKSSGHDNTSKALSIATSIVAVATFLINLAVILTIELEGNVITFTGAMFGVATLIYLLTIPCLVYIIGSIFVIIMKARHTAIVGDVYTQFQDFERYLNKACSTMPSYIDYEVLFTRKEIRDGIPALQDYLEKRALEEQREREAEEMRAYAFEEYDFEELGLENALLIERAMVESEKFFNIKRNLNEKINSKQTEMSSYQKNFDEVTKEFEKKAQAYRENLKQLNEQLNSTSVNIEANYIKKRYREDQAKLQQLEKDYEIATIRFNKQQNEINAEVNVYQKEIDRSKGELQRAMTEEGKSYANKIYGIINTKVIEQNKPIFDEQVAEIESLKKQLEDLSQEVKEKEVLVEDFTKERDKLEAEILAKKSEIEGIKNIREYLTSPEFAQVVINRKKARKNSGIDGMSIEELRNRTATAEEELRIANAKQEELLKNEQDLKDKLKRLEKNERQLIREKEALAKGMPLPARSDYDDEDIVAERPRRNVSDNLNEVNANIMEANTSLQLDQEELMGKINKTLEKLDEGANVPVEEEAPKSKPKKNISNLMANVNKLKSKNKK